MIDNAKLDELLALAEKAAKAGGDSGEMAALDSACSPETIRTLVQEVKDWRSSSPFKAEVPPWKTYNESIPLPPVVESRPHERKPE